MLRIVYVLIAVVIALAPASAQDAGLNALLETHRAKIEKPSRTTIGPVLDALVESKLPSVAVFLEKWREKDLWQREADGRFFFVEKTDGGQLMLIDVDTGAQAGLADRSELDNLKPNSGVRGVIAAALVQFQLSDPDPERRLQALTALERDANQSHLSILRTAIESETDPAIKARKERLQRLLTIKFGSNQQARVAAIKSFAGDPGVDARAALNPLLATSVAVFDSKPEGVNVARLLAPGSDIEMDAAYQLLVDEAKARPIVPLNDRKQALVANIKNGMVAGITVAQLVTQEARDRAYLELAADGTVPPLVTREEQRLAVADHVFAEVYAEPDTVLTTAAKETLANISGTVGFYQFVDLALDGLSLASIYFLAAIGLAITFGVMGVINMAHGEFIMIGAYTGYVVQQYIPNYTVSIIVALPLAFAVAFLAGVALERLVIRHLAHRPLETLLATFGISIALQQIAKNIFGTQARPLTSPSWLDGAWVLNDVVSISYIRIAIFVLSLAFLGLLLFILNRTRLGLEVRAVTQNPRMASSMGINPDRINMLTFGLGSGIAGIAGVAIGLFAKVTSELGSGYIVQSFMTVVVGGVGNIWGTLAGAGMIGSLQKVIEFFNPSNTLAAQTYMIIFIIIFIQFRPKGIIALKGRAAGTRPMQRSLFMRQPSVLVFIGLLAIFTVVMVILSEGFGLGLVSTSMIKILGKTLCLCLIAIAMDLVWGYCGILSLGHFAFFGLGGYMIGMWLMYERTKDIVIASLSGGELPATPEEIREGIGSQIFGVVGGSEITVVWYFADSLFAQLALVVLVPGLLALVFGWLAFRSRVTGVYLSILTQAMTLALSLYLFQNDSGLRGNNGLSGLQNIPGLTDVPQSVVSVWFFLASALALGLGYLVAAWVVSGKFGNVIRAIRDDEARIRFMGYPVEAYKLVVFTLTAVIAAIAGALYYPQAGIINPAEIAPIASIYLAVWVAIGGRGRLYGAVIGAATVSVLSSWFTGGQAPSIPLGFFTINWVDWWQVLLGLGFVLVTLFVPKGIGGMFDRLVRKDAAS